MLTIGPDLRKFPLRSSGDAQAGCDRASRRRHAARCPARRRVEPPTRSRRSSRDERSATPDERGAFVPIVPGVLRSAAHSETFESRAMAVQLHVEPDGALSGPTAGRLLGLRGDAERHDRRRRRQASPDLAARLGVSQPLLVARPRLRRASGRQLPRPQAAPDAVDAWRRPSTIIASSERPRTRGTAAWRRRATLWRSSTARDRGTSGVARSSDGWNGPWPAPRPSRAVWNTTCWRRSAGVGLPEPVRQHPVRLPSGELIHLDLAWPEVLLGVEPGHSWWHGGDLKMRADMAWDRACGQLGWHIVRYDEDTAPRPRRRRPRAADDLRQPPRLQQTEADCEQDLAHNWPQSWRRQARARRSARRTTGT